MIYFPCLRFAVLRARTLCCRFGYIPDNSEPTLICGLGQIFAQVHQPQCATGVNNLFEKIAIYVLRIPKERVPSGILKERV